MVFFMAEGNWTRLAKAISWVVKHCSAKVRDATTSTGCEPKRRKVAGPYFSDMWTRAWWRGLLRRWRWPIIGNAGGLGGSLLLPLLLFLLI